jgi:Flp pilus assembly pilin Flp
MSCLTALLNRVARRASALQRSEGGQDLIEYAMLAALIAVVAVSGVTILGNQIDTVLWNHIVNNF